MPNRNKIRSRKSILEAALLVLIILVSVGVHLTYPNPARLAMLMGNHSSSKREIWKLSDVYIFKQTSSRQIFTNALGGRLIFLGIIDGSPSTEVIAVDGKTGNILWKVKYPQGNVIAVSGSTVYVGGVAEMVALNSSDGSRLWGTRVLGSTVTEIVPKDDIVYFDTAGSYYALDAKNGNVKERFSGPFPYHMGVQSGRFEYWTTGEGGVKAVNRSNNQRLWQKNVNAISNLSMNASTIYILSENGNIVQIDAQSGFSQNIIKFAPAPFPRVSQEKDGSRIEYSYYTAVDPVQNLLFVYLGDSGEIFAYQLN